MRVRYRSTKGDRVDGGWHREFLQANNEQALADFTIEAKTNPARISVCSPIHNGGWTTRRTPADRAEACVATLRRSGYPATCVIGSVLPTGDLRAVIRHET
jgi:hypothetical protein